MKTRRLFFVMPAIAIFLALSACNKAGDTPPDAQIVSDGTRTVFSEKLFKATDAGDLETRLKAELTRRYQRMFTGYMYWGFATRGGGTGEVTATNGLPQTQVSADSSSGGGTDASHSDTTVQEKGVDEGDLVKTDGAFIYLARGTHFFVVKATPANETAILSDLDLKEPIRELYLSNNLVTIITTTYSYSPVMTGTTTSSSNQQLPGGNGGSSSGIPIKAAVALDMPVNGNFGPGTRLYTYDVTSPAAPVLTSRFDFPGQMQGSRRINTTLYLVTNYSIDLPNPVGPWDYLPTGAYDQTAFTTACALAKAENLRRIEALTLSQLLPTSSTTLYAAGIAGAPLVGSAVDPTDVYIPEFGNGTDLSLVISLDFSSQVPAISATAVLSSWGGIYMSTDSLYLTSDNYWLWIEPLTDKGQPQSNPEPQTAVHKFAVSGSAGKPLYRGSGLVQGWLNNRFSLGEYQGYLRIGTTRGGWWDEERSNQLAVLAEEDGSLVSRGTLTGLAPGESIYSMRFDRDRGYMVTFLQTDPLFTLDLSDPANPRVAGEIKINGFATYIHLLGTDRLLTIGRSADATGRVIGNKLQLFNVSDLAAPVLLQDYELGQGWSDALYDPHAFLYYEPLGILTIPNYSYSYGTGTNNYQYTYTSGLNVFTIGAASITPRAGGLISAPVVTSTYGYSYIDSVDRAVIIGSNIYALAQRSITVADANQLNTVASVILPESYWYSPYMSLPIGGMPMPGTGTDAGVGTTTTPASPGKMSAGK